MSVCIRCWVPGRIYEGVWVVMFMWDWGSDVLVNTLPRSHNVSVGKRMGWEV